MTKIKAVFFDVDNTLYDTTRLAGMSRRNAIRAMIEAGLPAEEEDAMGRLEDIVEECGKNFDRHYDRLLEDYGIKSSPRMVAAGVVAYHSTKTAYLVPYPETVPALLRLRDMGLKLGVITNGLEVKQWEKIIRLGLQHFFHTVIISEDVGVWKPSEKIFRKAARAIKAKPTECMMVGDSLDKDVAGANKLDYVTVQVARDGVENSRKPVKIEEPDYLISDLSPLPDIVSKLR